MKLFDLLKEGALTKAARENSNSSNNSNSRVSEVATTYRDDLFKNSNNSNNSKDYSSNKGMCTDEDNVSPPLATAISAIPAKQAETPRKASVRPYFAPDGGLVIPFGSDRRYWWWAGGQSSKKTIEEVRGWKR